MANWILDDVIVYHLVLISNIINDISYEYGRLRGGEPVTRLLLTSGSMLEDTEEPNDKYGEGETGPKLPPAGTARTAWQALQEYLVEFCSSGL